LQGHSNTGVSLMAKAQGIRAGKAYVELGVSNKLAAGLKRAQKQLRAFGAGVRQMGQRLVVAASGVIAPALAATKTFTSMGDHIAKMAKPTGVSTEALSELGFAAEQSGSNLETLEAGLRRMSRVIKDAVDGLGEAQDALKGVGLSAKALEGLSPEAQFKALAAGLSRVSDASRRAALAQEIFGRSGTQLLPLVEQGVAGMEALQEQARALGLTISSETAADAELLTDTLNILKRSLKQVVFTIGAALSGTVVEATAAVTQFVTRAIKWVQLNRQIIVTVAKVAAAVGAAGAAMVALGISISLMGAALGGIATLVGVIGSAIAALISPAGLAVAAIAGLGAAFFEYTRAGGVALAWLSNRFAALSRFVRDVVGGISDALAGGDVRAAANVMWAALRVAWETGTKPLQEIWATLWAQVRIAAVEVWSKITGAFRSFRQYMESAFPNLTAAIVETWSSMVFALRSTWAKFQKWLTDQVIKIWGFFDETIDVQGMLDLNEQELKSDLDAIEAAHAARVGEAIRKQQRTPDEIAAEHALEDAEAEARKREAIAGALADRNQAIADAAEELHKAQDDFTKARNDAAAARARADLQGGIPRSRGGGPDFDELVRDAVEGVQQRISVVGTFNPAAIRALSGGSDQLVRLGTEQRDLLQTIARNQRAYRPTFV
jgi:hypothetical protein